MPKLINGKLHTAESIVRQYKNLVYFIALRLKGSYETEDLASEGFIGLLRAFEKYDPSRGIAFSTFANNNIYQHMLKLMRKPTNGPHFSHGIVTLGWQIVRENLDDLTAAEISEQLDCPIQHVDRALLYLRQRTPNGMDAVIFDDGDETTIHDVIGKTDDQTCIYVEEFINSLDYREQTIVRCLYQNMSQREISKIVGISQMHVSRLIRKIGEKYHDYDLGVVS